MDKQFVKFWVSFLGSYMKTAEQMEDMSTWIAQGFKGFDELTELFQRSYGLDRLSESTTNYLTMWEQSTKDFERSLKEYLSLMGVVPKQEHLELVEKYEALKERAASQDETIVHLRKLLEGKELDQREFHTGFESLIRKQSDDFQRLIKDVGAGVVENESGQKKPPATTKKVKKKGVTKKAQAKK